MVLSLAQLLNERPYPGRFLILGVQSDKKIAIYGVTARSPASRAKRYVLSSDAKKISVESTDPSIMAQGNLKLLDYTALYIHANGLVIGNGRQTTVVKSLIASTASEQLTHDLRDETFEPDAYSTPRITGCWLTSQSATGALHIIRNDGQDNSTRDCYTIDSSVEGFQFISTYAGPNIRPTPSFTGGPIEVSLEGDSIKDLVAYVYQGTAPQSAGQEDLRVSIVGVSIEGNDVRPNFSIINAVDTQ